MFRRGVLKPPEQPLRYGECLRMMLSNVMTPQNLRTPTQTPTCCDMSNFVSALSAFFYVFESIVSTTSKLRTTAKILYIK